MASWTGSLQSAVAKPMGKGIPLTPEQIQRAAELFALCGNYSSVARKLHLSESAVRKSLQRKGHQSRAELRSKAIERGIHEGLEIVRKFLASKGVPDEMAKRILNEFLTDGVSANREFLDSESEQFLDHDIQTWFKANYDEWNEQSDQDKTTQNTQKTMKGNKL